MIKRKKPPKRLRNEWSDVVEAVKDKGANNVVFDIYNRPFGPTSKKNIKE